MHQSLTILDAASETRRGSSTRLWLWFNLLSLDAPLVAVLWQALFARCLDAPIRIASFAALALSVWFIYVSDRLLDALRPEAASAPRHRFYREHWSSFAVAAVAALFILGWICSFLHPVVLRNGLLMLGAILAYFSFIHLMPGSVRRLWPKELAVGMLFAAGTSLATWSRTAAPHRTMVLPICLFTALCWLNCSAIEYWEWTGHQEGRAEPHAVTMWLGPHLHRLAFGILIAGAALFSWLPVTLRPLFVAFLVSAAGLYWLDRKRNRFSADALRVLADVALLSPIVLMLLRL